MRTISTDLNAKSDPYLCNRLSIILEVGTTTPSLQPSLSDVPIIVPKQNAMPR